MNEHHFDVVGRGLLDDAVEVDGSRHGVGYRDRTCALVVGIDDRCGHVLDVRLGIGDWNLVNCACRIEALRKVPVPVSRGQRDLGRGSRAVDGRKLRLVDGGRHPR